MKIDKTRFLLLTTSIAATAAAAIVSTTGCSSTTTKTDAGSSSGSTPTDSGTTDEDATTTDGGTDTDATADGGACLANTGAAPMCGPAGEGEDAGGFAKCATECDTVSANFKTDVAKSISDCMDLAPTCEGAAEGCVAKAIAKACDDPDAVTFCTAAVASCTDAGATITQADCETLVRGMSVQGRTDLQSCVDESLCSVACFDAVKMTGL